MVPTSQILMRTLATTLPSLRADLSRKPDRKPIRLIVIDSLPSLLQSNEKGPSNALYERSKTLWELSHAMHVIAARDNIAFVVINEVTDVFERAQVFGDGSESNDVLYRDQAPWFGSAHSIPQESRKEALLGLVWANQINARVMLTRTNRRRYTDYIPSAPKRRRTEDEGSNGQSGPSQKTTAESEAPVVVRRLSVVFSSVSHPTSVDFIITNEGFCVVDEDISNIPSKALSSSLNGIAHSEKQVVSDDAVSDPPAGTEFAPAGGLLFSESDVLEEGGIGSSSVVDENEAEHGAGPDYWEAFDEVPYEEPWDVDFDALDTVNVESTL